MTRQSKKTTRNPKTAVKAYKERKRMEGRRKSKDRRRREPRSSKVSSNGGTEGGRQGGGKRRERRSYSFRGNIRGYCGGEEGGDKTAAGLKVVSMCPFLFQRPPQTHLLSTCPRFHTPLPYVPCPPSPHLALPPSLSQRGVLSMGSYIFFLFYSSCLGGVLSIADSRNLC